MGAKPHIKRVEGFPLDSLSIDVDSGKYHYDLEVKDVSTSVDDGVRKFFSEILKRVKFEVGEEVDFFHIRPKRQIHTNPNLVGCIICRKLPPVEAGVLCFK